MGTILGKGFPQAQVHTEFIARVLDIPTATKFSVATKVPMGTKIPMTTKVPMTTKSSMATKVTLAVLAHM